MSRGFALLLMVVCIGGLIASGVLSLQVHELSKEVMHLKSVVLKVKPGSVYTAVKNTMPALNGHEQQLSTLHQEMTALRQELRAAQEHFSEIGSVTTQEHYEVAEGYEQEQQQQQLSQLVDDAVGRGFWSHEDAEAFRDRSIGMSPQAIQRVADGVIRAIEQGHIQMPEDLVLPF